MGKPNQNPTQNPAIEQANLAAEKQGDAEAAAPEKAKAVEARGDLAVAVNLITQTGSNGKPEDVLPGTVFRPAKADVQFFLDHGAIREPTDAEIALYEQVERNKPAATAPDADEALG